MKKIYFWKIKDGAKFGKFIIRRNIRTNKTYYWTIAYEKEDNICFMCDEHIYSKIIIAKYITEKSRNNRGMKL